MGGPVTRSLALASLLAALPACSTLQVRAESSERADFARYRAWAWRPEASVGSEEPRVRDPATSALVRRAIERELASHGLKRVEREAGPDFLVDYFGWSRERTDVKQSGTGLRGSGYTYDPGASSPAVTEVRTLRDGTLMVDFFDARTGERTWRGTANDSVVAGASPGAVEAAVTALLAQFPPRR
jgi:hypothetical protein